MGRTTLARIPRADWKAEFPQVAAKWGEKFFVAFLVNVVEIKIVEATSLRLYFSIGSILFGRPKWGAHYIHSVFVRARYCFSNGIYLLFALLDWRDL
jgi:hypothetical protein